MILYIYFIICMTNVYGFYCDKCIVVCIFVVIYNEDGYFTWLRLNTCKGIDLYVKFYYKKTLRWTVRRCYLLNVYVYVFHREKRDLC